MRGRPPRHRRIPEVPGADSGEKLRVCYSVEPLNVERSRWRWRVWLEFRHFWAPERWSESMIGYEMAPRGRSGPHECHGTTRDQQRATDRARAAVDDARRRIAASEVLRMTRRSGGFRDTVDL